LQAPGYLVINREDGSGGATPNAREVISFTGISGSDITGVTRGADGSTAQAHNDGALVEATVTVGLFNSLATIVDTAIDNNGLLRSVLSPVSIARVETPFTRSTQVLVSTASILQSLDVSNASVTGLGLTAPVFRLVGNFSGPTTIPVDPLVLPRTGTWSWWNVITRTVASTSSVIVDINLNGTSIFDAGTRPGFLPGATFASTASIKTKAFTEGDRLTIDIDAPATGETGHITDLTIIGRSS